MSDLKDIECVILLSGPIAVGKTTMREALVNEHGFSNVRSSDYLRRLAAARSIAGDRLNLQELGDELDRETDFRWLIDEVALPLFREGSHGRWLVDAVRKERQVEHFRAAVPGKILHVHLTADESDVRRRFAKRLGLTDADASQAYSEAISHSNEQSSRRLVEVADLVIDTSDGTPDPMAMLIARVGLAF